MPLPRMASRITANASCLRRSIAQEKVATAPPKKGRKRIAGQGEMLLPIAGNKRKETVAEPAERPSSRQKNVG
jgi:hypothetical protein